MTDPLSDSCRIRICALQDTLCDVSDGNFSIVSSQGYLGLVRSSSPNAPLTSWNFGAVECPNAASQWFRLKNFGSESIVVFQPLEPATSEFSRTTPCGTFFALAPNQMSACSVRVVFDPASDGIYNDVLRVQTDAVNGVNGFVEFGLNGEQISTPAAPEVVITTQGEDARLSWAVVDSSLGGCDVTIERYLVFYAPSSNGPYYYHGWTADTTYVHTGVVAYASGMFYQVVAMDIEGAMMELERIGEEMGILRKIQTPPDPQMENWRAEQIPAGNRFAKSPLGGLEVHPFVPLYRSDFGERHLRPGSADLNPAGEQGFPARAARLPPLQLNVGRASPATTVEIQNNKVVLPSTTLLFSARIRAIRSNAC
ncbi:MAG: hypothetical protein IPP40_02880 [bacterium]|nr:hypothetical protein [bacterium]